MAKVDQRGFDNQPSAFLAGRDAARLLGVKRATLYAYASRGLVRSVPDRSTGGRARRYARADLEALKARHDARAGHGPVAAAAMRWGEPVLETAISAIDDAGPRYRGRPAVDLARDGASFEAVAELLWTGAEPESGVYWPLPRLGFAPARLASFLPPGSSPLTALTLVVPVLGAADAGRFDTRAEVEAGRARTLLLRMAASLALGRGTRPAGHTVARLFASALGARRRDAFRAIDLALVLCADHELNASTLAARVTASAGADLYACVSAGLAALSGPRHGGACDRVEALLAEAGRPARARMVVHERARRGEEVPGFGHRLYPAGDPRAKPLLDAAAAIAPRSPAVRTARALVEAVRDASGELPTLDLGLVALAAALRLPPGSPTAIFAIGRVAGWVAHTIEQRHAAFLIRPRARYVGP